VALVPLLAAVAFAAAPANAAVSAPSSGSGTARLGGEAVAASGPASGTPAAGARKLAVLDLAVLVDESGSETPQKVADEKATVGTIVGAVVAVLLVLGFIASPERRDRPTKPLAAPPPAAPVAFKNVAVSNEPTPVLQDPAEEASTPRKTLALEFDDDSWAKIDADGETVLVGLIKRGDVRRFQAREGFRLTLGNAGAVRLSLDGRPLERLGGAGEVIRDVPVPRAPARG